MSIRIQSFLVVTVVLIVSWAPGGSSIVTPQPEQTQPQVPCYFVFGDSLSDSGNNNNLQTLAKANYQPYGVDFPGGVATGRFTNNRTFVDVITQLLGFDRLIPSYNQNMGVAEASQGVNYASGGGGILFESGRLNLGDVISFSEQIDNHATIVSKIGNNVNLSKCLYTINIGSNDYINNYFMNQSYPTSKEFTPTEFASYLIADYRMYTQMLYEMGARKISFYLLGQIGCSLGEIVAMGANGCVESVNNATAIFDIQLASLVSQLNRQLPGAQFIYINSSAVEISAFTGVTVFNASCCTPRSDGQCQDQSIPCLNRYQYYFWDLFHPTDAVVKVLGERAYKARTLPEAFPYDISTLVQRN